MTNCLRVQTSYSQNWPCWNIWHSKKNKKCLYNYWPAETKAKSAPYFGGTWRITVPRSTFWGDVSPCPPRDLRLCALMTPNTYTQWTLITMRHTSAWWDRGQHWLVLSRFLLLVIEFLFSAWKVTLWWVVQPDGLSCHVHSRRTRPLWHSIGISQALAICNHTRTRLHNSRWTKLQ